MEEDVIRLYPGNWLYNAGVIGLLEILDELGENVESSLKDEGYVDIRIPQNVNEVFDKWDILTKVHLEISYKGKDRGTKNFYYVNQTEKSIRERIDRFKFYQPPNRGKERTCVFCFKKEIVRSKDIKPLTQAYGNILLGSERTFSNLYWNNSAKDYVCSKCQFIIMCHHLALTKLSDESEIFINAPSFKIMWHLNRYAKEIYGREKAKATRELLGMTLIEMALKLNIQLGKWTMMNIEIVSKSKDKIDFFSLPYDVVSILSNRNIAALLNDIGEISVLDLVLDGNFKDILSLAERIFKIALKSKGDRGKQEDEFINNEVKLKRNRSNLTHLSQELFELYALLEEKTKKGVFV
ncbi:MAG: type I-B CRISPR-associated protein Cas8b1/Cst1 [Dictyoglomaceae bacterium]|nr:type I-B CRISPR-associated protein Cas8b1/Cst1 [Dictyoglomaceae bacterium]HPU43439.1 type I-B CRISPR-associated protein Cas8b1/Cst1 [Dictyoglomaceae bacterium]